MKKKSRRTLRSGRTRRRTLLLSRKAKVRKGLARKTRRVLARKTVRYGKSKKGLLLRKKRRLRRKLVRKVRVSQPPVLVVPVSEAPPAPQVIPLPRSWAFRRKRPRQMPFNRATPKHTTWGSTPVSPRASRTGISWNSARGHR